MNNIMTIVKKEFKDILRDRKTLLMTFVIPIIIMPLLFTFIFSSVGDMASPSEDNKYKIVLETNNPEITAIFKEAGIYELLIVKTLLTMLMMVKLLLISSLKILMNH
ncbi:MAG: hypothetical protein V8R64_10235 [Thomasclavelia sp.]